MDRQIIYSGQVPQTTDLLSTNKQTMIALAKLCSDLFGTASLVSGLACVPTSPASMSVNINPGQIYQLANVDGTAYSAIPLDTTHSILKQGILMDAQSFALTAPGTVGFSQNYLIQATYLDNDINNTVLPYYNSANPSQAFNGPGGNGTSQPTTRAGQVSLQLVAGTAATTGSQTTPAVTTGYVGLWVITVANGQSTITSSNITQYAGAPILPSSLLASIQNGTLSYAVATGTANAHTVALTPALTARVDGMMIRYKAPAANTGAVTLADGVGTANVLGANHSALQGGEYAANGDAIVMWNSSISGGSYILVECTGGAVQVAPATQSQHAIQLAQMQARIGTSGSAEDRNIFMNPDGRINQHGYATGTATTVANQMTLDGYRVIVLGQSLGVAVNGNGVMMTAPAGGVQVIVPADRIDGGTYVFSWSGTATFTVNGTAVANGGTAVLPAATNATFVWSNGTFTNIKGELGTIATPFVPRKTPIERVLCREQFECFVPPNSTNSPVGPGQCYSSTQALVFVSFKVTKRVAPTGANVSAASNFSLFNPTGTAIACTAITFSSATQDGIWLTCTVASGLTAGSSTMLFSTNSNARIDYTGAEL